MFEHRRADSALTPLFTGDHFPGQWERAIAARETESQHLKCFEPNETAIQHNRDLLASPGLENFG